MHANARPRDSGRVQYATPSVYSSEIEARCLCVCPMRHRDGTQREGEQSGGLRSVSSACVLVRQRSLMTIAAGSRDDIISATSIVSTVRSMRMIIDMRIVIIIVVSRSTITRTAIIMLAGTIRAGAIGRLQATADAIAPIGATSMGCTTTSRTTTITNTTIRATATTVHIRTGPASSSVSRCFRTAYRQRKRIVTTGGDQTAQHSDRQLQTANRFFRVRQIDEAALPRAFEARSACGPGAPLVKRIAQHCSMQARPNESRGIARTIERAG